MNFYKHYIGDFQRDTGHLSLTERGAYLCLMHHYYATEKPLPNDHAALCRVAGAITKAERDAVRAAMGFFEAVESGLMHPRIEAEIHKAGKQADTNREIAIQREAARKAAREANEQSTNRETNRAPNQTPDTRHQEEESTSVLSAREPTAAGSLCKALKAAGIGRVAPGNVRLTTLLDAGATEAEFMAHVPKALDKGNDAFAYLLGIVEGERKRAAATAAGLHRGALPNKQEAQEQRNRAVAVEWLAQGNA